MVNRYRGLKTRDVQSTVQNIQNSVYDGAIILMHDLYGETADVAVQIIDWPQSGLSDGDCKRIRMVQTRRTSVRYKIWLFETKLSQNIEHKI